MRKEDRLRMELLHKLTVRPISAQRIEYLSLVTLPRFRGQEVKQVPVPVCSSLAHKHGG